MIIKSVQDIIKSNVFVHVFVLLFVSSINAKCFVFCRILGLEGFFFVICTLTTFAQCTFFIYFKFDF